MSEVATIEQDQTSNVLAVISRAATDSSVDIGKMERLLDMQERVMARNAHSAFLRAMSELQSVMPTIRKEGEIKVGDTVRSRYARFEDILSQTQPLLKDHGFSVTFKSDFAGGKLSVTGTISHVDGHSESTTMELPFDDSGAKNKVQQIGSSVSYGKRYVYCMLLNVNITEMHDDGVGADLKNTPEAMLQRLMEHNDCLRENLASVLCVKESLLNDNYSGAKEAWLELSEHEQRTLWLATTKGGVFTTLERQKMKSSEWGQA